MIESKEGQDVKRQINQTNQQNNQQSLKNTQTDRNINKANYQFVGEINKKLDFCSAITFNQEATIMLLGNQRDIRVYNFNQGVLEEKQKIATRKHGCSQCLYYMNHRNMFVSAGSEKTIQIFAPDKKGNWLLYQNIPEGHCAVNCVIMNFDESLLISCNNLQEIKFRKKAKKEYVEIQTLKLHKGFVNQICLNKSQTALISIGEDKRIIICQQRFNEVWVKQQVIQLEDYGSQICFINDNLISLYSEQLGKIKILQLQGNLLFKKSQDVAVPKTDYDIIFHKASFNEKLGLFLSKNNYQITLLRLKNDQKFEIEQQITFNQSLIVAAMTSDGQYLVTWDIGSKKLQVRKQQQ